VAVPADATRPGRAKARASRSVSPMPRSGSGRHPEAPATVGRSVDQGAHFWPHPRQRNQFEPARGPGCAQGQPANPLRRWKAVSVPGRRTGLVLSRCRRRRQSGQPAGSGRLRPNTSRPVILVAGVGIRTLARPAPNHVFMDAALGGPAAIGIKGVAALAENDSPPGSIKSIGGPQSQPSTH